jgi:hypothetical protein
MLNSAGLFSVFCGYDWGPTFAAKLTHEETLAFLSILLRAIMKILLSLTVSYPERIGGETLVPLLGLIVMRSC